MRPLLAAVIASCSLSAAFALSPEPVQRAERALAGSEVSASSLPDAPDSPSPSKDAATADALNTRQVFRAALELTGVCRNQTLAVPGWCPKPGQAVVAPDGGLTVITNDEVELELTVPLTWAVGRHAFMLISLEGAQRADPKPAMGTVVDFGVPGVQLLRFRADRPGDYVFFDPYGRSVMGRFTVRP